MSAHDKLVEHDAHRPRQYTGQTLRQLFRRNRGDKYKEQIGKNIGKVEVAGILIGKGIQNQKNHGKVNGESCQRIQSPHKTGRSGHKYQHKCLCQKMFDRPRCQISCHGRRHQNGKNHPDYGIFHPEYGLKHIDKNQDKDHIQSCKTEIFADTRPYPLNCTCYFFSSQWHPSPFYNYFSMQKNGIQERLLGLNSVNFL